METPSSKAEDIYQIPVVKNGRLVALSLSEFRALLALPVDDQKQTHNTTPPVKPDRVVIGTSAVTGGVMELGKFDGLPLGLAEIITREPLAYRYRGANYPIKFSGVYSAKDLAGIGHTNFEGKAQPGHDRPKGFFKRNFPDAKSSEDFYYQQGDNPDEEFKGSASNPSPNVPPATQPPIKQPTMPDTNVVAGDNSNEQNVNFFNQ